MLVVVTVWHELGHLCAAWLLRIPVKRIALGFGPTLWRAGQVGQTEIVVRALPLGMAVGVPPRHDEQGKLRRPINHDLFVAAAGPAASLLLTVLTLLLAQRVGFGAAVQPWLAATGLLSALLVLLNLLPIPGLDGGHVLVLAVARWGLALAPEQELQLHRAGVQVLVVVSLISMAAQAWWLVA
jgi:membrane-associated protease RseP (regulator of RpoE activity)